MVCDSLKSCRRKGRTPLRKNVWSWRNACSRSATALEAARFGDKRKMLDVSVHALHNNRDKDLIRAAMIEIVGATQEQRLPQRGFERSVARLDAAVSLHIPHPGER